MTGISLYRQFGVRFACLLLAPCLAGGSRCDAAVNDLNSAFDIAGAVNDIRQSFSSSGYQFDVRFSNIEYQGRVEQTLLERKEAQPDTVWLGLRDVRLTLGETTITGKRHSARCGPLSIQIGDSGAVWLSMNIERAQEGGAEKLQPAMVRFRLPPGNWSVSFPSWVQTRGFGMTESKVVSGLRTALQRNPQAIEEQFMSQAPLLLSQVESRVQEVLSQVSGSRRSVPASPVAAITGGAMSLALGNTSLLAVQPAAAREDGEDRVDGVPQALENEAQQPVAPRIPETPYRQAYQVTLENAMEVPVLVKMCHVQPDIGNYRYYLEPGDFVTRYFEGGERVIAVWDTDRRLLLLSPLIVDRSGTVSVNPKPASGPNVHGVSRRAREVNVEQCCLEIDPEKKPRRPRQTPRSELYGDF